MRISNIDEDELSRASSCLDLLLCYKLMNNYGFVSKSRQDVLSSDEDDVFNMRYEFYSDFFSAVFEGHLSYHLVNDPEEEISKDFPDAASIYSPDDLYIEGIVCTHPAIVEYHRLCKENGISPCESLFANMIQRMWVNMDYTWGDYYNDFFVPEDDLVDKYPLCLFNSEVSSYSSVTIEILLEAFWYAYDVATHPDFEPEMLTRGI